MSMSCALNFCLRFFFEILISFIRIFIPRAEKSCKGKVVLITGAGQGIGQLTAYGFAKRGAKLVLWDLNSDNLQCTESELRRRGCETVRSYVCDVSKAEEVRAVAKSVRADVGDVDILVNNAGIMLIKPIMDKTDAEMERTMSVNTLAHFWTTREFLGAMRTRNSGHVVNIASLAGVTGLPNMTDYCASKYAVVGFSESLAHELRFEGFTGIHVTYVMPHITNTALLDIADIIRKPYAPEVLLEPAYVAEMICSSTLRGETRVVVPWFFDILTRLIPCLPFKPQHMLADLISDVMVPKGSANGVANREGATPNLSLNAGSLSLGVN